MRRNQMIETQLKGRGIQDRRVLDAMQNLPRHLFVPKEIQEAAYDDNPLPIGHFQTISQPYIVAYMTEALQLQGTDKVLEIGTGSGYQAALLAKLAGAVYTIEILEPLYLQAQEVIRQLQIPNISFKLGDGWQGWPEEATFDKIMVTAATSKIPAELYAQLKEGGLIIFPFGKQEDVQTLVLGKKTNGEIQTTELLPVRFVPLLHKK